MIITDYKNITFPTVIALGFFDGVHKGHSSIINTAKELAGENTKSLIYTLDTHPSLLFGSPVPMITSQDERMDLLKSYSTDYIFLQKTDRDFLNLPPETFIKDILINKLRATHIISGENYTFGRNKSGSSKLLKKICEEKHINYTIVPFSTHNDNIISSTLIRQNILSGNVNDAAKMLGRPFSIYGKVVRCRNVGKTLGFPTANIIPDTNLVLPKEGVYATNTVIDKTSYKSITNVGKAPTFNENKVVIETFILDFTGDIYSENIKVEFIDYLRGQVKFDSPEKLSEQLSNDVLIRRKI